jgi:hypothetical protein
MQGYLTLSLIFCAATQRITERCAEYAPDFQAQPPLRLAVLGRSCAGQFGDTSVEMSANYLISWCRRRHGAHRDPQGPATIDVQGLSGINRNL